MKITISNIIGNLPNDLSIEMINTLNILGDKFGELEIIEITKISK